MTESISKKTTSSLEDYLEAIVILKEQHKKPTVTALSESINVRKPSVDWALKKLSDAGLVIHKRYGDITLTPKGAKIANEVYRRHKALYSFLTDILKVDPEIAEEDACRMEHALSQESINRLEKFIDFFTVCHPGKKDWEDIFNRLIEYGINDTEIQSRFTRRH
jgi:DtxR family transcriptional regulator, Mn-dependent transcriptional regulator